MGSSAYFQATRATHTRYEYSYCTNRQGQPTGQTVIESIDRQPYHLRIFRGPMAPMMQCHPRLRVYFLIASRHISRRRSFVRYELVGRSPSIWSHGKPVQGAVGQNVAQAQDGVDVTSCRHHRTVPADYFAHRHKPFGVK